MLTGSNFIHSVIQFQYTGWPDFGAPTDTKSIIALVSELKKKVTHLRKKECKVLVHCSAGVGRTGTFIALYLIMEQLKDIGLYNNRGILGTLMLGLMLNLAWVNIN